MCRTIPLVAALAVILVSLLPAATVTIDTVPVGNAGNASEPSGVFAGGFGPGAIVGGVDYDYRIGTYEVTNAQYAEFLNAKAASDPLELYNEYMGINSFGGIARSGTNGAYTYAVKPGMGNKPVVFVTWYDAIRFANWLNNGQGNGDTESGAYTILGGTPTPSYGLDITRNVGATWFLPSENEWYKAAYHTNDGVTGNYYDYPTQSNTAPTAQAPPGGANSANYLSAVVALSEVGAYSSAVGPYGTYDQAGNVYEWNEAVVGSYRGLRGGSWDVISSDYLKATNRVIDDPLDGNNSGPGVRVATIPEPSMFALAALGSLAVMAYARRRAGRSAAFSVSQASQGLATPDGMRLNEVR
jgi:formylglycine-generating enzyme required for sulfatase activity